VPTSPAADLYIHTDPVVDREVYVWVYLDGGHKETIRHSDGRLQILGLPLGQHRLELQVPKYEPYEETVDLAAGLNVESVTLVPAGSGGPSAPSQPLSRATAEQANADEAVPTFEVAYFHGLHKTNGQLTVSKEGLVFNGYGTNAADKFNLPCSEVVEAKMPSSFVRNNPFGQDETSFHVKGRSKKYYFDTWDKNGVVRDTILRAIRSACNLR